MNLKKFFRKDNIWFNLLLAVIITAILVMGALIFLNIYTRHGKEVDMPDFVGANVEELMQSDISKDFVIVVSDSVFDKSKTEGTILKQNPGAKEKTKKGRKVYVTVASSIPPKVSMPELKDVSLRQAEIMLKAVGLELGGVILKSSPFENAVLEQLYNGRAIASGTQISMGDKITLVVGKDLGDLNETETDTTEQE